LENENDIIINRAAPRSIVNPIGKRGVKPRRKSNLHVMNYLCSRFLLITDTIIVPIGVGECVCIHYILVLSGVTNNNGLFPDIMRFVRSARSIEFQRAEAVNETRK